jgi:electron transport complex protein RnfD
MLISFTGPMTTWLKPVRYIGCGDVVASASPAADALTCATPLAFVKKGELSDLPSLWDMAIGNMPGCIGEVSAIALALGGLYLLWRKVITWHIPVSFLATVAVYSLVCGRAPAMTEILTGGIMIGAIFMATDYVTSPTTGKGKLVFGFGCGLLCMLIRQFGGYPEGCSFAILIMNALCPLVNRWTQPKPFGAK